MNNIIKTRKQLSWRHFILLGLAILTLGGCSANQQAATTNGVVLEEITNDLRDIDEYVVLDYLDYSKILVDANNTYANDPRYANQTPDGLIDWRERYEGAEREDLPQLLQQVTVNGRAIQFPLSFAELDANFAAFDTMDLRNLKEENLTLTFKNNENGYMARFSDDEGGPWLANIVKEDVKEINVYFREGNGSKYNIIGLDTTVEYFVTTYDLRIAGIGIGNTFNEMYVALGQPTLVVVDHRGVRNAIYRLGKDKYSIYFESSKTINDPFQKREGAIYENVITDVSVTSND